MLQLIVTGKLLAVDTNNDKSGNVVDYCAIIEEKIWNGKKEETRNWSIALDKYWGERLIKANVTIKYFGFMCDAMRVEGIYQSGKQTVILQHFARGNKFFTL